MEGAKIALTTVVGLSSGIFGLAMMPDIVREDVEVQWEVEEPKTFRAINVLNNKVDPAFGKMIAQEVEFWAHEYNLDPLFVVALMNRESSFKPQAVSNKDCVGLMQINPRMHQDKIQKLELRYVELFHVAPNIQLGCWIISDYIKSTGSYEKALQRYVGPKHKTFARDVLVSYGMLKLLKE